MPIRPADLDDPRVVEMYKTHVSRAAAETEPGSAHALTLDGLRAADVQAFALWEEIDGVEVLLGMGAVKDLGGGFGEVKSMFVDDSRRRTGAGSRILTHLIETARACGMTRLSLETGSWPYFDAAVAMYQRHGFELCPPFGTYREDPNSLFLTREV